MWWGKVICFVVPITIIGFMIWGFYHINSRHMPNGKDDEL